MSTDTDTLAPVDLSPAAFRSLSVQMRQWSGWRDATLRIGVPTVSPWAECTRATRSFTFNIDELLLNPHRVLHTVTPFRLRQEAVLTGAMLHEAGHARYTRWKPEYKADLADLKHGDGTAVTAATLSFASLLDEPRVEARIAAEADRVGADHLVWTMRAMAAHLMTPTVLDTSDPDRMIMDLITSWVLRAARHLSLAASLDHYTAPPWVHDFNNLLHQQLVAHFCRLDGGDDPLVGDAAWSASAYRVRSTMLDTITSGSAADEGTLLLDYARDILALLFPETDPPVAEDPHSDEDESGDESDDPDSGGAQPQSEAGEPGDGGSGSESDESEDGDPEDGGESEDGDADGDESEDGDADEGDESGESGDETDSGTSQAAADLARALASLEQRAENQAQEDTADAASEVHLPTPGSGAGVGDATFTDASWRHPSAEERAVGAQAERFLRNLLAPSESAKRLLTDSPSSQVDGGALAAWRAGGQKRDPRFFVRHQRNVTPSPPVQIAVLVDVSMSMEVMQGPSALLSWALSNAALDLRNYAGRGQQITSTLIHWGSRIRVVQPAGATLPGLCEFDCNQFTTAMAGALAEVEHQLPGFFDPTPTPVNRLLVQFTDWELGGGSGGGVQPWIERAMSAGVNMLSVVPTDYSERNSALGPIMLRTNSALPGRSVVTKYNKMFPDAVWDRAAELLG